MQVLGQQILGRRLAVMQEVDVGVLTVLEATNGGPCPVRRYELVLLGQVAVPRVPSSLLRHLVVINAQASLG